jgi:DeoR/GlpR family transcriptional regulator of sugar metabolism
MWNGSPVICSRMRETITLGEVPIRVISPPSREPNASGISTRDAGFSVRRATWIAIGMKIASAPMFLIKAESAVTADASTATWMTLVRIRGTSGFIRLSTNPERPIAALTTRAEPTMMTMSSLKPRNASPRLTMPQAIETSNASRATKSYRMRPQTSRPMVPRMIANANA